MDSNQAFKPRAPQVISENIDGEVVIINLDSGTYYSTTGVGAVVWDLVEKGHRLGGIVEALQSAHASQHGVEAAVARFVQKLKDEALVVPQTDAHAPEVSPTVTHNGGFEEPKLTAYQDMKDMLLLDPIHDVDEAGWPTRAEEASASAPKSE